MKKTLLMTQAEDTLGRPLQEGLADLITEKGLSGAAQYLGVAPSLLNYWVKINKIRVAYIALSPWDTITITRDKVGSEV